jgi:hypothetical protein
MTDINETTIVEGQQDLFTGEVVEETAPDSDLTTIVRELTETVFGTDTTISPYKIAKVINGVFETVGSDKRIPPQMMYNYSSKGMIVKGFKGKEYTKDQVETYVNKYTVKYF